MGKGVANPIGMVRSTSTTFAELDLTHGSLLPPAADFRAFQVWAGQMMLDHLGEEAAAKTLFDAIEDVLGNGGSDVLTPDMGGSGSTQILGEALVKSIESSR